MAHASVPHHGRRHDDDRGNGLAVLDRPRRHLRLRSGLVLADFGNLGDGLACATDLEFGVYLIAGRGIGTEDDPMRGLEPILHGEQAGVIELLGDIGIVYPLAFYRLVLVDAENQLALLPATTEGFNERNPT